MAHDADPPRRYDDQQVARILERATELHRDEPVARRAGDEGLTLAELQEIAVEAGIDPRHLRRAAMEVEHGEEEDSPWRVLVGEDLQLSRRMVLPGEIHPDDFDRIVGVLQAHSEEHGQPSQLGRTLTWRAETSSKNRTIQVNVSSRDGETAIEVDERLNQLAASVFGGGVGGFGGGFGFGLGIPLGIELLGSVGAAFMLPLGFVGLSFFGARALYRRLVGRRRQALADLTDALVDEVQRAIAGRAVEEGDDDTRDALPPT